MPASRSAEISPGARFSAAFTSIAGWSFDLFDLFVLLYVADALSKIIFPSSSPTLSLAEVYASFGVSILLRPAGAAIFGAICDRHGRKPVMAIVLAGVGLATAAMGAVPAYAMIGVWSPVVFLVLRVIQGVFVGGVVAATHTLGTESVGPRWRGLMSGLIGTGGAGIGAALASVLFIVLSRAFPGGQFDAWGWRVMFFAGLLSAALSYLVLRGARESPLWQAASRNPARTRLADLVRGGRGRAFTLNVALVAGAGSQYYLTSGYLPTLLEKVVGVSDGAAGTILLLSSVSLLVAALGGELSEHLGRRRTMLLFGGVNIIALPLLAWLLGHTAPGATGPVLAYAIVLAILANLSYTPVIAYLNERYPTGLRSRGTAVCWNTGFMIGGLMPTFLSLASPRLSAVPGRLAGFLFAVVAVYLVATALSPETRGGMEDRTETGALTEPAGA